MTKEEFIQSNVYLGKLLFIDQKTNTLWNEELLSTNSKKAKALLAKFPQGGIFRKTFVVKFLLKGESAEFNLGLEEED